jgi:hypothetical protein
MTRSGEIKMVKKSDGKNMEDLKKEVSMVCIYYFIPF